MQRLKEKDSFNKDVFCVCSDLLANFSLCARGTRVSRGNPILQKQRSGQRSVDFRQPISGPNSRRKAFGTRRNICVVDLWRQRVVSISSWLFQFSGLSSSSAQMQMVCQETGPCCDSLLPQ